MTPTTQTVSAIVPPDVMKFAVEQGVAAYLPPVLQMTEQIFPYVPLSVLLEDDPEIANDRHIVVALRVDNLDVSAALDARYTWHRELFACCPTMLVSVFRLGLELTQ